MNKKLIRKMLTAAGGPLFPWLLNTEWVDNWKFRTTPASRSRVLSGKGVETDKQYTERRKKETTKRTWRSDAADVAHGIGEGILALNPYTAIPYYGAKVGLDFLNGTYGWHTALNASVPLFHMAPQAVGLREATNVALEDAANAGSKTARNWRVAREIKLATKNKPNIEVPKPIIRTKVGDIEIDNPQLFYRQGSAEMGTDFIKSGVVRTSGGFENPMFTEGALFKKVPTRTKEGLSKGDKIALEGPYNKTKSDLLVTDSSVDMIPANQGSGKNYTWFEDYMLDPFAEESIFDKSRVPLFNGTATSANTTAYRWEPGYGYRLVVEEPSTSLKFFEKKPAKSVTKEYVQSPKDITSDVGDLIAEGSERSVYASKNNPNIVYKIEDGNAPLEDINNIKIRSEINDDIIAPETTIGYYKHKNGKYYRVTQQDKYKSYDPDNFYEEISPELNLEIIKTLEKAGWKVNIENGHVTTASKNGITIGNLEHFNWGRDSKGNLKLIDLYVVKKQGGKMNILEFLKNGSGIHIKEKNKGKFTSYCGGKVTNECILKGKNSSDPAVRKRATFADNARHFKHKEGGKAFVTGVNVLDSNPKAYKYVKKKYRMALLGTKLNFFLKAGNWLNNNGDLVKSIANAGLGILGNILLNKAIDSQIEANKKLMEINKQKAFMENYKKALGLQTDRSDIINMSRAWLMANNLDYSGNEELMKENALLENSRNSGLPDSLGGLASSVLNSSNLFKKSNTGVYDLNTDVGNTTYNWKTNTFTNKNKVGTINSDGNMNTGIGGTTYNWKTNTFGSNNMMNGFDKIKF